MSHHAAFLAGAVACAVLAAVAYYGVIGFDAYVENLVHAQVIKTLKELSDNGGQITEPPTKHGA